MCNCFNGILIGVILFCSALNAQDYTPGKMVSEIVCEKDSAASYILYLPRCYDSAREEKWPVMFVMAPKGGSEARLQLYVPGADQCGWILAMSIQSKNGYAGSSKAIQAMVDDVFKRFPVNKRRCYASGFSGGAREAFRLSSEMPGSMVGIIPCGAGDSGHEVNTRVLVYGLSGAICPNRQEMAKTFSERIKKQGVLRFFPGKHVWPDETRLLEAMVWMNGQYFEKQRRADEAELAEFSAKLLADIKANHGNKPDAYELCRILAGIKKAPAADEAGQLLMEMEKDPTVKTYQDAMKDVAGFSEKYFSGGLANTEEAEMESLKLAEKYTNTPYVELMTGLGKTAKW
ncbi:MAG: hypothetical protein MUC65_00260 [Pontiellaceae bacterium]|jgi:hypothetical protein|nr:hypothetical protein [Pontiellaceae bacterium]